MHSYVQTAYCVGPLHSVTSEVEIGGARFSSLTLGAHVSWDSFG